MATIDLVLPIPSPTRLDGSTDNVNAQPRMLQSSGTLTNYPKPHLIVLQFDPAIDQHVIWQFKLPANWTSGGSLVYSWGAIAGASGNVKWKSGQRLLLAGSTNALSSAYTAASSDPAATAVPGTGVTVESTSTLNMTGAVAGCVVTAVLGRDADAAADTANTYVAYLYAATFRYTGS